MAEATSAFSMGVDCPDIRNVVHVGPPSSLVHYVQEYLGEFEGTENNLFPCYCTEVLGRIYEVILH